MICDVCGKINASTLENKQQSLYRCGVCGHGYKKMPPENHEKYNENYFSETHKKWFDNPDYVLFELIDKEISKIKQDKQLKVLDVGCGKGDFLKYLKEKNSGSDLYGIDLSDNNCPGINFIKGDFINDTIGIKFDVISSLAVIEHIDSPHSFVRKVADHLSPGGLIFIMTVNDSNIIYKIAKLLKKVGVNSAYSRLYDKQHLQFFTNHSLKLLMEMNDLDVMLQKNHNYPLTAVDFPKTNIVVSQVYKLFMKIFFSLSKICKNGMLQTVICIKKERIHGSADL